MKKSSRIAAIKKQAGMQSHEENDHPPSGKQAQKGEKSKASAVQGTGNGGVQAGRVDGGSPARERSPSRSELARREQGALLWQEAELMLEGSQTDTVQLFTQAGELVQQRRPAMEMVQSIQTRLQAQLALHREIILKYEDAVALTGFAPPAHMKALRTLAGDGHEVLFRLVHLQARQELRMAGADAAEGGGDRQAADLPVDGVAAGAGEAQLGGASALADRSGLTEGESLADPSRATMVGAAGRPAGAGLSSSGGGAALSVPDLSRPPPIRGGNSGGETANRTPGWLTGANASALGNGYAATGGRGEPGARVGGGDRQNPIAWAQQPPWHPEAEIGEATVSMLATFRDQPAQYYLGLPPPWNIVPDRPTRAQEAHKMARSVEEFDGTPLHYTVWRAGFLSMVHRCATEVDQKICLLFKSFAADTRLDPRVAGLRRLPPTPQAYKTILETLELEFGGERRLLTSTLKVIQKMAPVRLADVSTLRSFRTHVAAYVDHCREAGRVHDANNIAFFNVICSCLATPTMRRYKQYIAQHDVPYDVFTLLDWLSREIKQYRDTDLFFEEIASSAHASRPPWRAFVGADDGVGSTSGERLSSTSSQDSVELAAAYYAGQEIETQSRCPACGSSHEPAKCAEFLKLSPAARRKAISAAKRCYICLKGGHIAAKCFSKKPCDKCPRLHHPLLHQEPEARSNSGSFVGRARGEKFVAAAAMGREEGAEEGASELAQAGQEHSLAAAVPGCALRTVPVILINKKNGRRETYNAFVDDGCSHAIVSERVAKDLALTGDPVLTNIQGVGGQRITQNSLSVDLQIQSLAGPTKRNFRAQVLKHPAGSLLPVDWSQRKFDYPHLEHIEFPSPVPGKGIDLLLGQACPDLLASKQEVVAGQHEPVARRTLLGWTVAVLVPGGAEGKVKSLLAFSAAITSVQPDLTRSPVIFDGGNAQLEALVSRSWEVARTPGDENLAPSAQQRRDQQRLKDLSYRGEDGKMYAPVLWRDGAASLPFNRAHCMRRLESLEQSRHFKNETVKEAYTKQIADWIKKGYAVDLGPGASHASFYLSHFPVVRLDKAYTKVRVVLDGADAAAGMSLNDALSPGPNLLNTVPSTLLRARRNLVMVGADVREMFLQVHLREEDLLFHRFLWREHQNQAASEIQLRVHPFGSRSSPTVALYTAQAAAKRAEATMPRAAEAILRSTIVDDTLDSVATEEEAVQLLKDIRHIYSTCGMEVAKFVSSSERVLDAFPQEDRHVEVQIPGVEPTESGLPNVTSTLR